MLLKIFVLCIFGFANAIATPSDPHYEFLRKFAIEVGLKEPTGNVIVSPASVFTAMGLAYLDAEGSTATEMQNVLHFENKTKEQIAQFYAQFMHNFVPTGAFQETDFQIANRIFVDEKYELAAKFNELATKYLQSRAEKLNFVAATETAEKINAWVAENTKNKIQHIIGSDDIKPQMAAILVNALYFRAHWEHRFDPKNTMKKNFFLTPNEKVPVDMMYSEEFYQYAEWEDLDATAVQIPFVNTDIYMLIILPKSVDGLKALQEKIKMTNWCTFNENTFSDARVQLSLPKFKFEYSISLNSVLRELGLTSLFEAPDFSSLLTNGQSVPLSDVVHKAFIEVDEIGTEASAATIILTPVSDVYPPPVFKIAEFNVDHPFMFAIKNKDTIYFSGHVNKF